MSKRNKKLPSCGVAESLYHRPICNHSVNDITPNNLGYTFGVFADGVPFEAELWQIDNETDVTFYLPDIDVITRGYQPIQGTGKVTSTEISTEQRSDCVLSVGMAIREPGNAYDVKPYVEYLVRMGAVVFETEVMNGGVEYLCDIEGNDVVCVHISLNGIEYGGARANLHFRDFPGRGRSSIITLLKGNN